MTECRFFGRKGCFRRDVCRYLHIQRPFGFDLTCRSVSSVGFIREEHTAYGAGREANGIVRYTAAYKCPPTGTLYYPEQNGGRQAQKTGIWWYATRGETRRALAVVVACAQRRNGNSKR